MRKEDFVKKILKDEDNTVFVNKEQVLAVIELFEKNGMKPPKYEQRNSSISKTSTKPKFLYKWQ